MLLLQKPILKENEMDKTNTNSNLEEYDNPVSYDEEQKSYRSDIALLEKWAAKTKGDIIDIACGTGRATIPLAQKGYRITGVDIHRGMLNQARKKAEDLDISIEWVEQDCTQLQLDIEAGLVYTVGNSFQHFLTNEAQDGLLSSIRTHLKDGGIFIFGTRYPNTVELLAPDKEEYEKTYIDTSTQMKVDVFHHSEYDSLTQIQHNVTTRKFYNEDGDIVEERKTNIALRYVFPKEMERLLHHHGFTIKHIYKDWDETPLDRESNEMVYICEKAY